MSAPQATPITLAICSAAAIALAAYVLTIRWIERTHAIEASRAYATACAASTEAPLRCMERCQWTPMASACVLAVSATPAPEPAHAD